MYCSDTDTSTGSKRICIADPIRSLWRWFYPTVVGHVGRPQRCHPPLPGSPVVADDLTDVSPKLTYARRHVVVLNARCPLMLCAQLSGKMRLDRRDRLADSLSQCFDIGRLVVVLSFGVPDCVDHGETIDFELV